MTFQDFWKALVHRNEWLQNDEKSVAKLTIKDIRSLCCQAFEMGESQGQKPTVSGDGENKWRGPGW